MDAIFSSEGEWHREDDDEQESNTQECAENFISLLLTITS